MLQGATSDTYTPKAGDVGGTPDRQRRSYFDLANDPDAPTTDEEDSGLTAMEESDNPVDGGHPEQGRRCS